MQTISNSIYLEAPCIFFLFTLKRFSTSINLSLRPFSMHLLFFFLINFFNRIRKISHGYGPLLRNVRTCIACILILVYSPCISIGCVLLRISSSHLETRVSILRYWQDMIELIAQLIKVVILYGNTSRRYKMKFSCKKHCLDDTRRCDVNMLAKYTESNWFSREERLAQENFSKKNVRSISKESLLLQLHDKYHHLLRFQPSYTVLSKQSSWIL